MTRTIKACANPSSGRSSGPLNGQWREMVFWPKLFFDMGREKKELHITYDYIQIVTISAVEECAGMKLSAVGEGA
jgi:hypothetical protein